ncbi:MAG: divergent PAP2 family protein [archaeon]
MLEFIWTYFVKFLINPILLSTAFAWFAAQLIKAAIWHFRDNKSFIRNIFKSGGMPSSHTAGLVALCFSILASTGLSALFYAVGVITVLLIHDAVRSRRYVGLHASFLNKKFNQRFEENVGHTLWEVFWGIILGIGIVIVVFAFF